MWSILALGAVERIIHHLIDLDALTRIQLNQLQGKMLRVIIDSPQLSVDVFFDQEKYVLNLPLQGTVKSHLFLSSALFDPQFKISEATATLHVKDVVELIKLLLSDPDQLVISRFKVIITSYRIFKNYAAS